MINISVPPHNSKYHSYISLFWCLYTLGQCLAPQGPWWLQQNDLLLSLKRDIPVLLKWRLFTYFSLQLGGCRHSAEWKQGSLCTTNQLGRLQNCGPSPINLVIRICYLRKPRISLCVCFGVWKKLRNFIKKLSVLYSIIQTILIQQFEGNK